MKKLLIICSFILVSLPELNGQWYIKDYGVSTIEMLSDTQLAESLQLTNRNLKVSGGVIIFGGLMAAFFHYVEPGVSEDPGFLEELIGDEGMNKIGTVAGLGFVAGGSIGCIVFASRRGKIMNVIRNRNPYSGTLRISPTVISTSNTLYSSPGLKLTLTF